MARRLVSVASGTGAAESGEREGGFTVSTFEQPTAATTAASTNKDQARIGMTTIRSVSYPRRGCQTTVWRADGTRCTSISTARSRRPGAVDVEVDGGHGEAIEDGGGDGGVAEYLSHALSLMLEVIAVLPHWWRRSIRLKLKWRSGTDPPNSGDRIHQSHLTAIV